MDISMDIHIHGNPGYLLRFRSYQAKCVQVGCFHTRRWSTSLQLNFTWTGSSPINRSWHQKTRDTGLPDGEDCIPLRSLVLTIPACDGDRQTDGRICHSICSASEASFAVRCIKIDRMHISKSVSVVRVIVISCSDMYTELHLQDH